MYRLLKGLLRRIVPKRWLVEHELLLRGALAVFYRGKGYRCTVCLRSWRSFIGLPDGDLLCPYCGSISRTRRLYDLLQREDALRGAVLHFSPSRPLYRAFKRQSVFEYVSTDYEDEFLADHRMDITALPLPDGAFDTVICYHVLEHVERDEQAMAELHRVLRPGGRCFVQTPFREGETYEDPSVVTPEGRLAAFGQRDHVRVYSVGGLARRLERAGFAVRRLDFPEERKPHGLLAQTVLVASAPEAP